MTDAQSRERFERKMGLGWKPEAFEKDIDGEYKNDAMQGHWTVWRLALSSHPTPQRDEHITRMLDQLSGGVGTFLQGDGVGLSEYVRGLERQLADDQERIKSCAGHHFNQVQKNAALKTELATLRHQLEESKADVAELRALDNEAQHGADEMMSQLAERDALISKAKSLIGEQAEDDGLWFVADTITEMQLQKALRKISAIIEETDDFGIPLRELKP